MDDLAWNISTESSFSMFEILNAPVYFPVGREECWNTEFLIDHGGVQHSYSVPNLKHDMNPKSFQNGRLVLRKMSHSTHHKVLSTFPMSFLMLQIH